MPHECKHEADIAVIAVNINTIMKDNDEFKKVLFKIYDGIHGNGDPGLKTTVHVNTKTIALLRYLFLGLTIPLFLLVVKVYYG